MGSVFKSPKEPKLPPMPVYSELDSSPPAAAEEAKKKTRRYTGLGRASTILTSPLGVFGSIVSKVFTKDELEVQRRATKKMVPGVCRPCQTPNTIFDNHRRQFIRRHHI